LKDQWVNQSLFLTICILSWWLLWWTNSCLRLSVVVLGLKTLGHFSHVHIIPLYIGWWEGDWRTILIIAIYQYLSHPRFMVNKVETTSLICHEYHLIFYHHLGSKRVENRN
jgi:hypothetical protein